MSWASALTRSWTAGSRRYCKSVAATAKLLVVIIIYMLWYTYSRLRELKRKSHSSVSEAYEYSRGDGVEWITG